MRMHGGVTALRKAVVLPFGEVNENSEVLTNFW